MIKHVLFDVDGVFTDGCFYYSAQGKIIKVFGPHDGDGIKLLRALGLTISAISADQRGFSISKARMDDMGIPLQFVPEVERYEYINQNHNWGSLAFMGDGIYDAQAIRKAKFGIAPANATTSAKREADYVTKKNGGAGAVFEAAFEISRKYFFVEFLEFANERGLNEEDF